MEEVIQMDDDGASDDESVATAAGTADQQASLMSLIGFNMEEETGPVEKGGCFPHHIDPFSLLIP